MPLSDAGRKDPSMLGAAKYARNELDFYPTEARCTQALLTHIEDDLESFAAWEPFVGNGAIANEIMDMCRAYVSTDIKAYPGFDPDALADFFTIFPDDEVEAAVAAWERDIDKHTGADGSYQKWTKKDVYTWFFVDPDHRPQPPERPVSMADLVEVCGFRPDSIITNPPYDDAISGVTAEKAVRHALKLMEPEKGLVIMLLRHDWDTAKRRHDLFRDHPAFTAKITLTFRPRWIEGSTGSPRHAYAWYVWDFCKAINAPNASAELKYAE